jgi:hypothetical protein
LKVQQCRLGRHARRWDEGYRRDRMNVNDSGTNKLAKVTVGSNVVAYSRPLLLSYEGCSAIKKDGKAYDTETEFMKRGGMSVPEAWNRR